MTEGGTEVAKIGVSLLDSMETSLVPVHQLQFRENLQVAATNTACSMPIRSGKRGRYSPVLLVGLGILLVEWWYFQRRPGGVPS